jgi:GNAT superfamily N-acetyltransferase
MSDFYAEGGYVLDRAHAAAAFATILDDERLGYVWLIETKGEDVGHVVVTTRYAMEYGGLIACLDDLYVQPGCRNRGLAAAALAEVRSFCQKAGIRAMTVEVGFHNAPAQAVYRRIGFTEAVDRQVLALPLAAPTHVV